MNSVMSSLCWYTRIILWYSFTIYHYDQIISIIFMLKVRIKVLSMMCDACKWPVPLLLWETSWHTLSFGKKGRKLNSSDFKGWVHGKIFSPNTGRRTMYMTFQKTAWQESGLKRNGSCAYRNLQHTRVSGKSQYVGGSEGLN